MNKIGFNDIRSDVTFFTFLSVLILWRYYHLSDVFEFHDLSLIVRKHIINEI